MRITETLSLAALAATTLLGVVGAHGNPTTGELAARDIRESRARRSLAQCSEKLRARDRLHKRSSKRNALVERHLLKKRQVGGGSRGGQGQNQGQGGQQPGGGQQGGNNGGNQGNAPGAPSSVVGGAPIATSTALGGAPVVTSTADEAPTTLTSAVEVPTTAAVATSSAADAVGTSPASLFPEVQCVLTPELTVGPYYVSGELIREDIREDQYGIELLLDVQFVDVNTCEVLTDAYVDFWHCNTTGTYSGVSADNTLGLTFLRGIQPTDEDGITQIITNFPGWYSGRAVHIHVAAHINGTAEANSTYTGGSTSHIGQIFFPEEILEVMDTQDVYNTNSVVRLTNAEDTWFPEGNTTEYNAVAAVEYLGDVVTDGLLAYITIGVDTTIDYTEELLSGGGAGGAGGAPGGNGTFAGNGTFEGNGTAPPSGAIPSEAVPTATLV
ncbi:aromatic compound dioxygenase [Morchella conica CCBAS932]|uniref:Aromatic compound dioxygenase n=1 Tax=Morchella conica CCBAS932 TaxID=1392247 RepID=A0A3N4KK79_9PEZI|nr:aromatic compound dioxygenase [Morchella conica CCBAS932]